MGANGVATSQASNSSGCSAEAVVAGEMTAEFAKDQTIALEVVNQAIGGVIGLQPRRRFTAPRV